MNFDYTRNATELRKLFDFMICAAIGEGIAVTSGLSWLMCFASVIGVARMWERKSGRALHRRRGAIVIAAAACLFGLLGHWSDYRAGVFRGYDTAASAGSIKSAEPGIIGVAELKR